MTVAAWLPRKLGQCVKFLSGGTPSKAREDYWEGDIPWVSSGEMAQTRLYGTPLRISADGAEAGSRLVPADTVLVVVRGMSLAKEFRVSITQREMAFNQDLKALICKSDVDPYFLFYALYSQRERIRELATEASHGTKKLETTVLENIDILVPKDIEIQKQVAGLARAYDDLIENNRRRMALLEDAARQLFQEWFMRLRFPGHEHVKKNGGVPEGWERLPASQAIEINPKARLSDEAEHWSVDMADLSTNSMNVEKAVKQENRSGSKFCNGDTLFARITPCLENGKTGFVDFMEEGEVGRGSTEFIVLRSKRVTPEFVYCLARTYGFRENAIKSMVGSSGRQRVQTSCFDKFFVLIPPSLILELFAETVRPMFQQIKMLHAQNKKLREARDLLLPRLMSGEIVV